MSTKEQRLKIGKFILDREARRDSAGRLAVYKLPSGDGGGTYEVAGINDKYHPETAAHLRSLIQEGQYAKAETLAIAYMATYTDNVIAWTDNVAVEAFLRDSSFNRGPRGGAKIFQIALGVPPDGIVGSITLDAARVAEENPTQLLQNLLEAREKYERHWVGRDESSKFWKGLKNRWNAAHKFASTFIDS